MSARHALPAVRSFLPGDPFTPHPRLRRLATVLAYLTVGALAVALAAGTALALTAQPHMPASEITTGTAVQLAQLDNPIGVTDVMKQTPTQATCSAFGGPAGYARQHTQARLNKLIAAATALPNGYFRADVFTLAADAASPKGAKYEPDDLTYLGEDAADDCPAGTYGAEAQ
jgi:hypothetical protein